MLGAAASLLCPNTPRQSFAIKGLGEYFLEGWVLQKSLASRRLSWHYLGTI